MIIDAMQKMWTNVSENMNSQQDEECKTHTEFKYIERIDRCNKEAHNGESPLLLLKSST